MAGPIEQFAIKAFGTEASASLAEMPVHTFTNSSLWMIITVAVISIFMIGGMNRRAMVPGPWQSAAESVYEFISGMIKDNIGDEGRKFFPFIFTLFVFIFFGNLLGLIPYSFTFTSHIIVTFAMGAFVVAGVTLVGLYIHGFKFFGLFVPHGVPAYMIPVMIPIELISYLSRPVSLAVRLCANMVAGHMLLKVFAGFIAPLAIAGIFPFAMVVVLTGFEVLVAFLQAYVFTILTCLYLNDSIHLH
ncbi:MAG: F0F1 ATP synthase subunit A [Alphaproteobacteria bacterium]|nr:F0F1 ATP synthase subunit A [Alphaproteobacteria bacterium]